MTADAQSPRPVRRLAAWVGGLNRLQQAIAFVLTVLAIPGALFGAWKVFFPSEPPLISTQIVLDTSERMLKRFGGGTRLAAAKDVIEDYVSTRPNDNIALRSFGGGCGSNELLVDFGRHRDAPIREALADRTARGEGGMANAVIRATSDFNDLERFPPESVRQVIVLTAGSDVCDPRAKQKIADRMEELAGTVAFKEIRFRFVGLGVQKKLQEEVEDFAEEADAEVDFVDNPGELHDVVGATSVSQPLPATPNPEPTENPLGRVRLIAQTSDLIGERMRSIAGTAASPLPPVAPSLPTPAAAVSESLARGTEMIGEFLERIVLASPEPTPEDTASP